MAAYLIDCFVLLIGLLVLQALLYPANPIVAMQERAVPITAGQLHLWVFATATVPFIGYFSAMIASAHRATIGMRWLGLRVVLAEGGRVSLPRALGRTLVLLLPFELNHAVLFHLSPLPGEKPDAGLWAGVALVWLSIAAYLVCLVLSTKRQSVHDLVAGTLVVHHPMIRWPPTRR